MRTLPSAPREPPVAASLPPSRSSSSMSCITPVFRSSLITTWSVKVSLPSSSTARTLPLATISPLLRFQVTVSARTDW